MENAKQKKPWLDANGLIKSEQELKVACKSWGPTKWEEYLATIETSQREDIFMSPKAINSFSAEECAGLIFSLANEEKFPLLKAAVNACIRELSPKQRNVIIKYYWDGKTIVEIAQESGVSKQAVQKTMKAALSRLKRQLTQGAIQQKIKALKEILVA